MLFAVFMSLLRVVVSQADSWRLELEELGRQALERQVHIEALDARLAGLSPVLVLKNVRLLGLDGRTTLFSFREGTLGVDIIASLGQGHIVPAEFTIQGARLSILRQRDGRFSVRGIALEEPGGEAGDSDEFIAWLLQRANLNISDSTVIWIDQQRGQPPLRLEKVNLHIHNDDDHHQLKASLDLPRALGRRFELALDVHGNIDMPLPRWRGRIYLKGSGLHPLRFGELPPVRDYRLRDGLLDLELWADWREGRLAHLSGEAAAYNLALHHPGMASPLKLKLLSGLFDYRAQAGGWALAIEGLRLVDEQGAWPETGLRIRRSGAADAGGLQVQADHFRLEDLARLLLRGRLLDAGQSEMLAQLAPSGDVADFHLSLPLAKDGGLPVVAGRFSQLGIHPWQGIPGLHGLNGELGSSADGRFSLRLDSRFALFDAPELFRAPLRFTGLSGILLARRRGQGWQFSCADLQLETEDIGVSASLLLDVPDDGSSPFLDLQARFRDGNVARTSRYLPAKIMSAGLVDWLDRGLAGGRIRKGGVVFQGRLADFPFPRGEGQLRVSFEADNARINYLPGWPAIHDAHLHARFSERGMRIEADRGRIFSSRLSDTVVAIEDFRHARLDIRGKVKGEVKDALRFLVESPIQPQAKPVLDSMACAGASEVELELVIPLGDDVQPARTTVRGQVRLRDASLRMLDDQIDISGINGSIGFSRTRQWAQGIQARIMGGEARVDIETEDGDPGALLIIARGRVDSGHLARSFGLPAHALISGETDWRGELSIPRRASIPPRLQIRSQMKGVAIDLPAPLGKPADERRDSLLEVEFGRDGQTRIYARSKDHVSGAVMLDTEAEPMRPTRAYLHFGPGEGYLPGSDSLRLSGSLKMFRLSPWVEALKQGREEVTGSFVSLPLVFDMDTLQFAAVEDSGESAAAPEETTYFDADRVPLIQGTIRNLQYDDVSIGQIGIATSRLPLRKGIRLDSLTLRGSDLELRAEGEWVQWPNRDFTSLDLGLTSPNLGSMLSALGFSAILEGGETRVDGRIYWPDSPMGVHLSNIESQLKYRIEDGAITRVEPGAGRLLGLFSLAALPRRLMLDFSDAFGKGLHFDSIEGKLEIRDGSVFMDDNRMQSPLANIFISGRTGLVDREFDQLITVMPKGGDALTAVAGGMIFGPQIGAAILLVQKMLGKGLEDVTAIRYKITGSWEEPQITRLDQPKPAATDATEEDDF